MLEYIGIGGGLAFAAAVQPGPFQAYLLSRVAALGWRRTLPAALAPLLSDGPIALLALVVLGHLSEAMQSAMRAGGGLLLLFFAWRTFQEWRRHGTVATAPAEKVPRTLLEATVVNLLNPNPYIGWALILGPVVLGAWREAPSSGVAVVVAFYATLIVTSAVLILLFGSAQSVGPNIQRRLLLVSALVLAGLGVYQLLTSTLYFTAGEATGADAWTLHGGVAQVRTLGMNFLER
jgi:threonine/homoserine/homoserine lactone efflux protein